MSSGRAEALAEDYEGGQLVFSDNLALAICDDEDSHILKEYSAGDEWQVDNP